MKKSSWSLPRAFIPLVRVHGTGSYQRTTRGEHCPARCAGATVTKVVKITKYLIVTKTYSIRWNTSSTLRLDTIDPEENQNRKGTRN